MGGGVVSTGTPKALRSPLSGSQGLSLMTSEQVADTLAVSTTTIRRWERSGVLPAVRIGRLLRFCAADVEAFIDRYSAPIKVSRRSPTSLSDVPPSDRRRRMVTPADPVLDELGLPAGASLTDVLEATRRRSSAA